MSVAQLKTKDVQSSFQNSVMQAAVRDTVWTALCALHADVIALFAMCLAGTLTNDHAGIVALSAQVHNHDITIVDGDQLKVELCVIAQHVRDKVKSYTTGNSATQARKRYVEEQESNWQELAKLGLDVPTRYRGAAKDISEIRASLAVGQLPIELMCNTRKQPTALDKQHVEREVGEGLYFRDNASGVPITRGGEVIQEQFTRLMGILSFGCKPAPVGSDNPKAQTVAVYGKVKNGDVEEIWTTTFGGVLAILMWIVRVVTVFPVSRIESILRLLYTAANEFMVTHHYNFETAMRYAMRDLGEPEFMHARGLPSATSGEDASGNEQVKRARDETKKLQLELNRVKKQQRPPPENRTPQKSVTTGNPQGEKVCRDHNNFGCRRNPCNFLHKCEKCGDTSGSHGRWDCPNK